MSLASSERCKTDIIELRGSAQFILMSKYANALVASSQRAGASYKRSRKFVLHDKAS